MSHWKKWLPVAGLLLAAGAALFLSWKSLRGGGQEVSSSKPPTMDPGFGMDVLSLPDTNASNFASASTAAAQDRQRPARRVKGPASDMTEEEKAEFEKKFAEKIKPVVEKWCKLYAGHSPFRAEDVTADKLRERIFPGSPSQGYGFMINGTTLCVEDHRGIVYVEYLMSPGAKQLFQLSKGDPPLEGISVSREEILRLLKADSDKDYPPGQIAIRPTNLGTAMNGGVFVDVGEGVNDPRGGPLPDFSMVFGPDGNLAAYLRSTPERKQSGH